MQSQLFAFINVSEGIYNNDIRVAKKLSRMFQIVRTHLQTVGGNPSCRDSGHFDSALSECHLASIGKQMGN